MVIISYPCLPLMDVFTYGTIDMVYQLLLKRNYQRWKRWKDGWGRTLRGLRAQQERGSGIDGNWSFAWLYWALRGSDEPQQGWETAGECHPGYQGGGKQPEKESKKCETALTHKYDFQCSQDMVMYIFMPIVLVLVMVVMVIGQGKRVAVHALNHSCLQIREWHSLTPFT